MLAALLAVPLALVATRQWLLHRKSSPRHQEAFDGVVYRVGEAAVAERHCEAPRATVLCMHGFVEDLRYFVRYYQDPDVQLIALASGGYHVPIHGPVVKHAPWARVPAHPHGSISYDAEVLVQALEHLPRSRNVRVHGHSRGGAVVLEAARLRPELFRDVEVVLEAPVLPQGRAVMEPTALEMWAFAFRVHLWRAHPLHPSVTRAYGPLTDPRKRELLAGFPHSTERVVTMVHNMRDIERWMRERDDSLFQNLRRGTVLVPMADRVLAPEAMLASASRGAPPLELRVLEGCSHFVLLDRPEALPPLDKSNPGGA
jgi:pimeloyl-ACP methyl ester carboxylesterase